VVYQVTLVREKTQVAVVTADDPTEARNMTLRHFAGDGQGQHVVQVSRVERMVSLRVTELVEGEVVDG
jgi:hypothetical protein